MRKKALAQKQEKEKEKKKKDSKFIKKKSFRD